ncbi:MAG TPA: molecular chaperone HtpG [Pseudomonadota bacterium]|nr:molecular chaperone HtpG [Pseudomonadota bacterium]
MTEPQTEPQAQTRRFEAEVAQVLHLVTHALYSHKEIFLRELVSNASDACDKLRFEAIAHPELLGEDAELAIEIRWDKAARTLSVRDNGIGMGRDEVVENIGTIARSGTRRFLESMSGDSRKDTQLIGQFGVGFYSAFVVADQVTLESRRAGAPAGEGVRWSSAGQGEYSIEHCELAQRGTTVTLHLKEGEDEFLDGWRLRSLVSRYSDHIGFPIRLPKEPDGSGEPEVVNQASALWTRPKAAIKDEEYQEFYRYLAHDTEAPLAWAHNRVEGNQSYTTLLYLPAKAPWDALYSGRDERKGLKLYVRRVFIMDASEQLLPAYLRFVKGVVDSDDLPLNVSRELLQDNRLVAQIRAACIKRALDLLDKLAADEPAKFAEFSRAFGNVLKEGVAEDYANRERVAKLLRFASTRGEGAEKSVALDDYVARMAEGQKAIWYVTADSWAAAAGSPQLEALKAAGIEVLLMHDRIDEWMAGYLREYAGKPLQHVAKGELDLPESGDPQQRAAGAAAVEPALERLRQLLGERVREVRLGRRLVDSPACLVLGEHDMALHLQRLFREAGQDVPDSAPQMEINPANPLVRRLATEADEARAADLGWLIYEQARITGGAMPEDPAAFVGRLNRLLGSPG